MFKQKIKTGARIGLMLILNRILSHPWKTFFHGAGSMFVTIKSSKVNSSTNCSYLFDPHERTLNNVSIVALTTLLWTELFHPLTRRAYNKNCWVSRAFFSKYFFYLFLVIENVLRWWCCAKKDGCVSPHRRQKKERNASNRKAVFVVHLRLWN